MKMILTRIFLKFFSGCLEFFYYWALFGGGVDLFLVYKKIKKQNYNKIIEFIFNYQKI